MNNIELVQYFDEERFIPSLKAKTKDDALEELIDSFVRSEVFRNAAVVLEMVRRREQLGSTGIGHGIAIPHGRTTASSELTIAFGYSEKGIKWEAIDGKDVHLFFMVVAPPQEEDNKYLPVLGRLVEILNKNDEREKIIETTTYSEFINLLKSE